RELTICGVLAPAGAEGGRQENSKARGREAVRAPVRIENLAGPPRPAHWEHNMAQSFALQPAASKSFTGKKRIRKSFGRIPEAIRMPNLIEVQRSSYEQFLQREVRPADRKIEGIEAVFRSVFPIKDFNERA